MSERIGNQSSRWKGGQYICRGYRMIHIGKRKYMLEHRLVMESVIGRKLYSSEIVHHKDGNKLNNDKRNLELHTRSTHQHMHHLKVVETTCSGCNKHFVPYRPPRFPRVFCSRSCWTKNK